MTLAVSLLPQLPKSLNIIAVIQQSQTQLDIGENAPNQHLRLQFAH